MSSESKGNELPVDLNHIAGFSIAFNDTSCDLHYGNKDVYNVFTPVCST